MARIIQRRPHLAMYRSAIPLGSPPTRILGQAREAPRLQSLTNFVPSQHAAVLGLGSVFCIHEVRL